MLRFRSAVSTCSVLACVLSLAGAPAFGQRYTSPPAKAAVKVAGKQIAVDYYAPSMHGRRIMGELVPFGQVWCPGANVATGLTTEADLQIGNLKLPKRTWSIWAIPGEKEWTLVINKQSGQHHLDYNAAEDFGRTKMTVKTLAAPVETFRIELTSNGGNKGTLALIWETTEASIPFTVLH
jgi:Protein of unknown function (DUF2911)